MRISVVIPARNEEQFILGCLHALKAQTLPPDEIIVVDNGSTDRTGELVVEMGVKLVNCPTPGVAVARQAGLEAATGDWVATTDADSRPVAGWLEALRPHMENSVALYGPMRMFGLPAWQEELTELGYGVFLKMMALLGKPNLAAANMAFHRQTALELGGYPMVEAREDVILGWNLMSKGQVRYVRDALVLTSARRVRGGWLPFLWRQAMNLGGNSTGYFAATEGRES
ncbi:glycosyl transferase [Meiothermus hypogaeus NBRC 106114]|uniref:Glycosyl transferase n=2 Tax=Meiothermus hypogaeus TaxID=884155 RepID=A0A511R408_9DEIN|nr:glycosyltransferase family 2 protein [Meiothermus hypogaeus]RIH74626.1 putative glycosyltransferase EpsJ [Meiothermus hypogaeus]GEM84353.1 glycosyl transferase [Meiothermus hypogaeus NBRC 106114]